jgi:hypothetical protein
MPLVTLETLFDPMATEIMRVRLEATAASGGRLRCRHRLTDPDYGLSGSAAYGAAR